MPKSRFWIAAAMAAVVVAGVSTSAEAFCHRYRSIPVWYGAYYPSCGPCGGCIVPYVASGCYSGYGYCGIGCGSGYGCGNSYGCGHGGCKRHGRWAAHKAWKRYLRGCGSCFSGCGSCSSDCGSCISSSGCESGCTTGCAGCDISGGDTGEVIHDAPMPPTPADQSAAVRRPLILLAGLRSQLADGSADFDRGLAAYRRGSLNDAARDFEAASSAEPDNALYHYYRALTMHDLYGAEAAIEARQQAVDAELREPVKNWGKRMERVQGRARVWIENARRNAGLVG